MTEVGKSQLPPAGSVTLSVVCNSPLVFLIVLEEQVHQGHQVHQVHQVQGHLGDQGGDGEDAGEGKEGDHYQHQQASLQIVLGRA